ncbi:MAG TPA: hypothetical protein VGE74_10615 [Gemmata sp.]
MTHTLSFAQTGGSTPLGVTVTLTGQNGTESNPDVPGSTTNQEEVIAFPYATLLEVFISSDVTLTLKTNSSSVPDDTITITAGKPLVWYAGCGLANPFTADVTKIYLTNATSGTADFFMRTLVS